MLSIVKMDFDSDVEVLEEDIKTEVIDIDENSNEDKKDLNILNHVIHDLQLIPIVYTTKLDDMFVMRTLYPVGLDPTEATARILKESKPVLRTIPGPPKKGRKNKRRFSELEDTLRSIYHSTKEMANEETLTEPDVCNIRIDSVKSEVIEIDEPIVEVNIEALKEQSTQAAPKGTSKYSELLKQCKPCSVLLPVLIGYGQALHGGQLFKASKVQKHGEVSSSLSSSDDDVPLITFPPDLLIERGNKPEIPEISIQPKVIEINSLQRRKPKGTSFEIAQRVLRNSLLEIQDVFSNEHFYYFTDNDGNLLHYFENLENKALYEATSLHEARYKISNCCWVKKDEFVMSLYPKVLKYPNVRFIRTTHPCKPGACTCCCRKKEVYKKPDYGLYGLVPSSSKKSVDDGAVRDLEQEIDVSIINLHSTPKLSSNDWLINILTAARTDAVKNSLIGKALNYKKPLPAKSGDNRRVVTLKKANSQNPVLVFRNYAEHSIEIYEVDFEGNVETYLRTTCYGNKSRPDVLKLLKKRTVTTEAVCCWYKREEVISKLQASNALHPDAIKFVRTTHTCQSKECKCCCKPAIKTGIKLDNISLPTRRSLSLSNINAWKPGNLSEKNDADCQITSVMTTPKLQQLDTAISANVVPTLKPLTQDSAVPVTAVPPSMFVTDVVDSDELSKEVNTLITSILDRFKDVRLTINGDGKVAAALNTPVNTLSTVELKVLANILSFAQSQINLLGSKVSSGSSLCLSNIINLKVGDVQSNTTIDPNTVYKEFGKNLNLTTSNTTQAQPTIVNTNPPLAFGQTPTAPQTYTLFRDSMSWKNQQFNDAFSSFVNSNIDANTETATPVIENVFSLNETETESAEENPSCTTVWYRKPASQSSSTSTHSEMTTTYNTSKNRSDDSKPETRQPKKLRVKSPTRLGASTTSPPSIMTANIPIQQTPPAGGVMPGVYVLPNNNFVVPSLAQPQIMVNSVPPSGQPPMLVINPLHNNGGTLIQPKLPIIMNAANSTSQVINTGNNYITVEKGVPTQEAAAKVMENPNPLNDSVMDSAADMEGVSEMVCVLEDEGLRTDYDDEMNTDEDIELKYSAENAEGEAEEDCILGF